MLEENTISEKLQLSISMFIEETQLTEREVFLLMEIIQFVFKEGRISGQEEILK